MAPFNNINPSRVSDVARTDDAGLQQRQTEQASFQEHLNALQPGQHWQAVPNSRLARRRAGSHADAIGSRVLEEEGAGEGGSRLSIAPPAHSPVQSFDQDELFAAADRAGQLPAASFASAQFWQEEERVAHSPAQSVNQEELPRSHAAIGGDYEGSSFMAPPRANPPDTGFGSAPDGVNFPHVVVADPYRPAIDHRGDLTGTRYTLPAEAPHQAAVVQQTRGRKRPRENPDEELFAAYDRQAANTPKLSKSSIRRDITALRKFSNWLEESHRTQIAGRVEDRHLDSLAKDFAANNTALLRQLNVALGRLRQASAGQPVKTARTVLSGTKDEKLLAGYQTKAVAGGFNENTARGDIAALRKFSKWLDENHRTQIAGRVEDRHLDSLAKDFAANNTALLRQLNVALGRLRQASAGQPVAAASSARPGTKDDEELLAKYQTKGAAAGLKEGTMKGDLATLRKFSKWLDENHRTQIAGRVEDRQLDSLAKDFAGNNVVVLSEINVALKRLRQASVGQPVAAAYLPGTKEDEELLAKYQTQVVGSGLKEGTMKGDLARLRKFSKWLGENYRTQIAGRIEDRQLDRLAADFAGKDMTLLSHVNAALKRLRQASAGQPVTTARTVLSGTKDEKLLAGYQTKAVAGGFNENTARGDITALRKFSKWLEENHRTQIAGRIEDRQLDTLAADFAGNDVTLLSQVNTALRRLRQASAGQPVIAASKVRSGTKDDEKLFAKYQTKAEASGLKEHAMKSDMAALRKFSKWLEENHRTQIAARLDDPGLDALANDFAGNNAILRSDINVALERLRQASAGQPVTTVKTRPANEGNRLIDDACKAAASLLGKGTLSGYRSVLFRFDDWLCQKFGKGITQIEPAVLSRAVEEYKKNVGRGFGPAWAFLQRYRQMVAANNALGLAAHGQAAPHQQAGGSAIGTQSASPVAFSPIAMSPGDPAWDVLRALNQEEATQPGAPMATNAPQLHQTTSLPPEVAPAPAPSSPAQSAGSSSTFAGLAPLSPAPYRRSDFDLNALTPEQLAEDADGGGSGHWTADAGSAIAPPGSSLRSSQIYAGLNDLVDLEDDARSAPQPDAARSRSIAGPSSSSSVHGEGSAALSAAHGRHPDLRPQLRVGPAASQESYEQSQLWRDVDEAEGRGPAGWERPWSEWSPQSGQDMGPTRPSASARSSDIYRGLDSLVDLPS
ncbi:hypothetical protein EHS39_36775, partial [Ensifer sp. MPMI2T]